MHYFMEQNFRDAFLFLVIDIRLTEDNALKSLGECSVLEVEKLTLKVNAAL